MTHIVFVHGWGSGSFVWKEILDDFEGHDCHVVNLGFLGDEKINLPDEPFIGVGHSLGGMWLLNNHPDQMTGFISIASFDCFNKHIPNRFLTVMKKNMIEDANKQLKDFWTHAGYSTVGTIKQLNLKKLIEGLNWLSKWESDIPSELPVKVLASRDDQIVPRKMTLDIWRKHHIEWVDDGGHMLPITQSEWCSKHIKEFVEENA